MRKCALAILLIAAALAVNLLLSDRPAGRYAATSRFPAPSPSGAFRLIVVSGYDGDVPFHSFEVLSNEAHPSVLFCSKQHYRSSDTTYFLWGPADTVWVYSGDTGTFYWQHAKGRGWVRQEYDNRGSGLPAPPLLKRIRPRQHQY